MSAKRKLQRNVIREGAGNKRVQSGWKMFLSGELNLRKYHTRMVNAKKQKAYTKKGV